MNRHNRQTESIDRETKLILIALFSAFFLCAGLTIYEWWGLY
jgi:hypothetical protein